MVEKEIVGHNLFDGCKEQVMEMFGNQSSKDNH